MEVGSVALERFKVAGRLGSGGMGTVYRAWDERLEREVALKEVCGSSPERALREAQAAARLSHPGIVTLYELGRDGDTVLLVSELVEGSTLAELASSGELSDREVARYGGEVCKALAHAHERGVVHRDVKPQNIIVRDTAEASPRAKLMDFGVAAIAEAEPLTRSGDVVGTLAFMAPEQAAGDEVGGEADLYSLALTLYTCWSGHNPVARPTPAATARAIGARLPRLGSVRSDLPHELTETIDACLRPDPLARPDLEALRSELKRALPGLDDAEPVPEPGSVTPPLARAATLVAAGLVAGVVAGLALVASLPGAALAFGVVAGLALLAAPLPWSLVALAAPALAAAGTPLAAPALAALGPSARSRALLGAAGLVAAVSSAALTGFGPPAGAVAGAGWASSAGETAQALVWALADPATLATAALWAAGAVALGVALRAPHPLLAAVGALVWAPAMVAAQSAIGGATASPVLALLAALGAVSLAGWRGWLSRRPPRGLEPHGAGPTLP